MVHPLVFNLPSVVYLIVYLLVLALVPPLAHTLSPSLIPMRETTLLIHSLVYSCKY